jgi:aminobenzoyl-glutamate transport protein
MPASVASQRKQGALQAFLSMIERGGNALPHPATLFLIFALLVMAVSQIAVMAGVSAIHPKTLETIVPRSLLSLPGLHFILKDTVTNFTGFAPLGTVLVALLGIGIAEGSGLIGATMRLLVLSAPRSLLTAVVVFAGIMSNVGSEIGYVLLVPLAARIFMAAGRHPLVGLAAAFAGVSGGYSANLLLGTVDPLLAGLTQEAARLVDATANVGPACNYYFMVVSTPLLTLLGWWVTERFVAPRFGDWQGTGESEGGESLTLSAVEQRGLLVAFGTLVAIAAVLLWGTLPSQGFLRLPAEGRSVWALIDSKSPFMSGIVTMLFLSAGLLGIAYGIATRSVKSDADVMKSMGKSMETLGGYLVLVFFAAQFVKYFDWTNLGTLLAVEGAGVLKRSGLGGAPLMVSFVLLTAFVNLFMGSASAKWALMAPIFVPMFLILGYPPELTQCAFRVGDSCTNIISPMMSYFALIISFFQRYDKQAGIGTLVATMLPYTIVFLIGWSIMLVAWILLDLPLGPIAARS